MITISPSLVNYVATHRDCFDDPAAQVALTAVIDRRRTVLQDAGIRYRVEDLPAAVPGVRQGDRAALAQAGPAAGLGELNASATHRPVSRRQEIERKFLVDSDVLLELGDHPCERITQGYISVDSNGTEVRVRAKGGGHTLTVKSGPSRTRVEEEIEIDQRCFESLWPLTEAPVGRRRGLLLRVLRHRHDLVRRTGDRDAVPRLQGDRHPVGHEQPDRLHHRCVRRQYDRRQVGSEAEPRYLGRGVLGRHGAGRAQHERHRADRVPLHRRARDRRRDRCGHHLHRRAFAGAAARPLHELGHDRCLRRLRRGAVHRPRTGADFASGWRILFADRRARRRHDPVHAPRAAAVAALARRAGRTEEAREVVEEPRRRHARNIDGELPEPEPVPDEAPAERFPVGAAAPPDGRAAWRCSSGSGSSTTSATTAG